MKNPLLFRRVICGLLTLILLILPVNATELENDLSISQGSRTLDGNIPLLDTAEELEDAHSAANGVQ